MKTIKEYEEEGEQVRADLLKEVVVFIDKLDRKRCGGLFAKELKEEIEG